MRSLYNVTPPRCSCCFLGDRKRSFDLGEEGRGGSTVKTIWGLLVTPLSIQQTWVWPATRRVLGVDWKSNETHTL